MNIDVDSSSDNVNITSYDLNFGYETTGLGSTTNHTCPGHAHALELIRIQKKHQS